MKPEKLLQSVPVLDAHIDTLNRTIYQNPGKVSFGIPGGHVNLARTKKGGVDTLFLVHHAKNRSKGILQSPFQEVLRQNDLMFRLVEEYPDDFAVTTSTRQIKAAHKASKIAFIPVLEDGNALEGSLENLRTLYRLGIRELGLVHQGRNELGNGNYLKQPGIGGLSDFGVKVVKELNRLGILVDVSHLNEAGFWDVVEACDGPFIASHSNARALCGNNRNLWDEQIKALVAVDGVMGMNFCTAFVDDDRNKASLTRMADHVCYIAELVGTSCIGMGTDYDGISETPRGLPHYGAFPRFVAELQKRGFSDEELTGILGGNFLRVFKKVCG
jgi:membrane dipeptidase